MSTEWYLNVIRGKLHGCNPNVRELRQGNMQVFFTGVEKGSLSKQQETISRWICLCWGFTTQSTQRGHVKRGQFT